MSNSNSCTKITQQNKHTASVPKLKTSMPCAVKYAYTLVNSHTKHCLQLCAKRIRNVNKNSSTQGDQPQLTRGIISFQMLQLSWARQYLQVCARKCFRMSPQKRMHIVYDDKTAPTCAARATWGYAVHRFYRTRDRLTCDSLEVALDARVHTTSAQHFLVTLNTESWLQA